MAFLKYSCSLRVSGIAANKSTVFCTSGKSDVICLFKAVAKLSCEIIRRKKALAQPSIYTMHQQLKVSVSLAGHFSNRQRWQWRQHFHGSCGFSCKEYQLTRVSLSRTDSCEEWWYWSVEEGEKNLCAGSVHVYFHDACFRITVNRILLGYGLLLYK